MRRSKYLKHKATKKAKSPITKLLFVGLMSVVFLVLIFTLFKVLTLDDFIYVNKAEDGSAEIVTNNSKYKISPETEVESARGYGTYKISSLWILSEKDSIGKLIPETITKNFSLPIYYWKNGSKSNLNLYQKLRILFFNKELSEDSEIEPEKVPNSVLIQFVNPKLTEITPSIDVEDLTGSLYSLDKVSRIIEVLGGKITSNSRGYDTDLDCEIYGKDIKIIKIFSSIFECTEKVDSSLSSDLKIRLGAKFAERF